MLSSFWFTSAKEDIDKRDNQVEGHQYALRIGMHVMSGEALRRVLKQKATMGVHHCLQLLHARL